MAKGSESEVKQIGPHGQLKVPLALLEEAGLGPKMRIKFRVEGKTIVIVKVTDAENPLDGSIGKKVDQGLFGKVLADQQKDRDKARELFDKGLEEAAKSPDEPPEHPFRFD